MNDAMCYAIVKTKNGMEWNPVTYEGLVFYTDFNTMTAYVEQMRSAFPNNEYAIILGEHDEAGS